MTSEPNSNSSESKEFTEQKPFEKTHDLLGSISVYLRKGYTDLRNFTILQNVLESSVEIRITLYRSEK